MSDAEREALMLRAAELYYYERLTQAAIADRLMCSRWTVGRLLEEARDCGMITISIVHPHARDRPLENRLRDAFAVSDAIVVTCAEESGTARRVVASATSDYLTGLRPRPATLGVSWGRTVAAVAQAMPDRWTSGLKVYQAFGGLIRSDDDDDVIGRSISLIARKGQGVGRLLPAPAFVRDVELAQRLRQEPSIARTLRDAAGADTILYSPGAIRDDSILVRSGYLKKGVMERLRAKGAVADFFSHFVDSRGVPVIPEVEDRVISIGLEALAGPGRRIMAGYGPDKALPMRVALAAGFATAVVTDSRTASAILLR